jgi:hypothetical protein
MGSHSLERLGSAGMKRRKRKTDKRASITVEGNINNEHGKTTKLTTIEIHSLHMGDPSGKYRFSELTYIHMNKVAVL